MEFRELLSTSSSDFFWAADPTADGVQGTLSGTADPLDIFDLITFGQFDPDIGQPNRFGQVRPGDPDFQQQDGGLRSGNGGLVIDSGGNAVDENGQSLGGNFGDEGTGNRDFNDGEIMRFSLASGFDGVSAQIDLAYDAGSNAGADVRVKLYDAFGDLIETQAIDLDLTGNTVSVADNFGATFKTIEIVALTPAASNLALTDLDIDAVFSFDGGAGGLDGDGETVAFTLLNDGAAFFTGTFTGTGGSVVNLGDVEGFSGQAFDEVRVSGVGNSVFALQDVDLLVFGA